jgi:hypothetical protein
MIVVWLLLFARHGVLTVCLTCLNRKVVHFMWQYWAPGAFGVGSGTVKRPRHMLCPTM